MLTTPLPDLDTLDRAARRDIVIRQHAQISSRDAEGDRLRLIVARLRLQFGPQSEKIHRDMERLELQLGDRETGTAAHREPTEEPFAPERLRCSSLPRASRRGSHLFAGSDLGGECAATIYSLIRSAKLHGLDSEAYLSNVRIRMADYPVNRIAELLPWNVALCVPYNPVAQSTGCLH
jgi:hypothetical protein